MSTYLTKFHQDGPIPVSESSLQSFASFCRDRNPSFDIMFYTWLCERHSDEFRRLCIRNLLRQPAAGCASLPANDLHYFYYGRHPLTRLFHVGAPKTDKPSDTLYWTLYNRPKLLSEFTEEFAYNVNHQYYAYDESCHDFISSVLQLLLTLPTDSYSASDLWQLHPYHEINLNRPQPEAVDAHLAFSSALGMPEKFTDKLHLALAGLIIHESTKLHNRYFVPDKSTCLDLGIYNTTAPGICYISRWLTTQCDQPDKSALFTIAFLIQQLEENLSRVSNNATYLGLINVIDLVPSLPHTTALALIQRHVAALYRTHSYRDEVEGIPIRDLEWLRGFCAQYLSHIDIIQRATSAFLNYRRAQSDE